MAELLAQQHVERPRWCRQHHAACRLSAAGSDARSQHGALAVPHHVDALRVNAGGAAQQIYGGHGIVHRFNVVV